MQNITDMNSQDITNAMPYQDIYKVYFKDNTSNRLKIFVFQGNNQSIDEKQIFSEYELLQIKTEDYDIIPCNQQIHLDDSVTIIKRKILNELDTQLISYDELYLFSKIKNTLDLKDIYNELTKDESEPITLVKLGQLFNNLQIPIDSSIRTNIDMNKDTFTYNDLTQAFEGNDMLFDITIPLGLRFMKKRQLLFSAQPFEILYSNPLVFQMDIQNPLLTYENHLLLSYDKLINNSIFLTTTKDVLSYTDQQNIDSSHIIQTYFPLLFKNDINNLIDLNNKHSSLIQSSLKLLKPVHFDIYKNINTLYNIYYKSTKDDKLPFIQKGIQEVDLILHPSLKTLIPLEIIFKQFHVTESIPFIKFNPGSRKDPLFRLYTTSYTKQGKKIPFLSRNNINQYNKITGKNYQISFVVNFPLQKYDKNTKTETTSNETFLLDIYSNGNIGVRMTINNTMSISRLNSILLENVNPILTNINNILELSGYKINLFQNVYNDLVEFKNIKYYSSINADYDINFKDVTKLLSNVFNVYEEKKENWNMIYYMRFKRVENYKEMNDINSTIANLYKKTSNLNSIIEMLNNNFNLNDDESKEYINKFLNEHIVMNGRYVNSSVDITDNPGFKCIMKLNTQTHKLDIEIMDINSVNYIPILHTYLDTFIRLTQYPNKSSISKNDIIKQFNKVKSEPKIETENVTLPNIIQPYQLKKDIPQIEEDEDDDDDGLLFMDSDEEDDDEEDDDEEDEGEEENNENNEKDELIEQAKTALNNTKYSGGAGSNVFFNKLKSLEPDLFRSKKEGKYDSYNRTCPNQSSRQPVILTKDELDKIDPSTYEVAMPYGSDPNNKFYYMCPRYWCFQNNSPMTQEQVDNKECGGKIIPHGLLNKPPEGHYIYEFTDERQHKDNDGNYVQHYPGFLGSNAHPNKGVPCCFKAMNTDQQVERRKIYNVQNNELVGDTKKLKELLLSNKKNKKEEIEIKENEGDDNEINKESSVITDDKKARYKVNLKEANKFPIEQFRWGFLPLAVELFLHTDNSTSVSSKNQALIKAGETPLLRYGVEESHNQSFISCIADIYAYHINTMNVPSIKEMRNIIIDNLNIDLYLKIHNASLVSIFQPETYYIEDIDVEKYKDSVFYNTFTDLTKQSQNSLLKDTIASYENFISYLNDDDSFIDHTYLWDIISSPDLLFKNGLNIALLEIEDNDNTNNISLICPTNSYIDDMYDLNKGTIILLKQEIQNNSYYEPIYIYGTKRNLNYHPLSPIKIFYNNNHNIPSNILKIFEMINQTTNKYCKPKNSLPNIYTYKQNLTANTIYNKLIEFDYIVKNQVSNYRGKIIGLLVSNNKYDKNYVFVPTLPSYSIEKIPIIYIDDVTWLSYDLTRDKLNAIHSKTNNFIKCSPAFKTIEDGLIVGLLTETNQFIQISKPEENIIEDDIPEYTVSGYKDNGYFNADKTFTTDKTQDNERINSIRNISLETLFYTSFRNKIRYLINDYNYKNVKDELVNIINNKQLLYNSKLEKIYNLLINLTDDYISFVDFDDNVLEKVNKLKPFVNKDDIYSLCLSNDNKICMPNKHLVTNVDNFKLYYNRIADELIRYNRIRLFMLNTSEYLNANNVDYSINNNEIVTLSSSLIGFENDKKWSNLKPFNNNNKYINKINYDNSQPYYIDENSQKVNIKQQYGDDNIITDYKELYNKCFVKKNKVITTGKKNWRNILHNDAVEIVSSNTTICSYLTIMTIMKEKLDYQGTIEDLKNELYKAYVPILNNYALKVYNILEKQGKSFQIRKVKNDVNTFENMIMNDDYTFTALDYWVLSIHLNLPIILFNPNGLSNVVNDDIDWLVLSGNPEQDSFYFVRMVSNTQYNLIMQPSQLRDLQGFQKLINKKNYTNSIQTFYDYITKHKIKIWKNVDKIKKNK